MNDPISESLELAAESAGDITEAVYRLYFERCPGSAELMSHIDHIVRGRMLEEVLRLLMQPDYCGEQEYLDFEMKNHRQAYSVEPHMYGNLLGALRDTIRDSLDSAWSDEFEAAWQARLDRLLEEISART
jgi:hypothetical protein